jgi:sn-glycerol 3-phosphate transport system permease protein
MILTRQRAGTPRFAWGPYLLLLPSFLLLSAFTLYPMLSSGWLSLHRANIVTPDPVFIGLENYGTLWASEIFRTVMGNTLLFAALTIPISVALALFLAVRLNRRIVGIPLLRAAFFYPAMLPLVSAAAIWSFMYNPHYGLVNALLQLLGGEPQNWLGTPSLALLAIAFVSIWKDAGYFMIFYLAGLQNLPADLYEAAELDGASPWGQFVAITWPLLTPTTLFVGTISFINAFKTVDQIFIMTGGGPQNASNLLLYHIFELTFSFYERGLGSAASVVLILILLSVAIFNHFYVDRRVHYE